MSAVFKGGPSALTRIRIGFEQSAAEQGCRAITEMRGTASMARCDNPLDYERANYLQVLRAAHRPTTLAEKRRAAGIPAPPVASAADPQIS